MCMSVLPAYIVYHVRTMPRKPEEGIGSPGLELLTVVSYCLGAGN